VDVPIAPEMALFGEISLSGLVRPVPQAAARLKEAAKLGFAEAMLPDGLQEASGKTGLRLHPVRQIADLVAEIAGGKGNPKRSASI
jgi:DNA repair protein RadA/Sms